MSTATLDTPAINAPNTNAFAVSATPGTPNDATATPTSLTGSTSILTSSASLHERVFLLDLRLRSFGTRKKAPVSLIQTDADKTRVGLSKRILDCDEMTAIKGHMLQTRRYIETVQIPTGDQFRAGMYLLPYTLLSKVEARLQDAAQQLDDLVDNFLAVYTDRIEADRTALASLFDERNYPSADQIRDAFEMEFKYVTLATPQGLQKFSTEVYEREAQKLQRRVEEAAEESITLLAEEARKLAVNLVERLTPAADGKEKIFRDSLLGNWNEFLGFFQDRNITGDAGLTALMDTVKAKIAGRTGDDLRKSGEVREDIRAAFEQVTAQLDQMITNKPLRRMRLGDVEEA